MTILKSILTFNQPKRLVTCTSCGGKGNVNTATTSSGTMLFCVMIGLLFSISLMSLSWDRILSWIIFVLILITSILTIKEYKEQSETTKIPKHNTPKSK